LNAQAMNLDVLDVCYFLFLTSLSALMINPVTFQVISTVPSSWPVNMMSTFLSRSFRRTLHAQQEGKIIKNISAGQNLEVGPRYPVLFYTTFLICFWLSQVKDRTWDILRDEGAIIEEAADDDDDETEDGVPQSFDEKVVEEKVAMHLVASELVRGIDGDVVKTAQNRLSPDLGVEDLR
jgi:hypothetical protein